MNAQNLTPQEAVSTLIALHGESTAALHAALQTYFKTRVAPTADERRQFCYPELRVHYEGNGLQPRISRAYAKFQAPGTYATTVTQPQLFRAYLEEQLGYLVKDYGATISVGISKQEIPYPYVLQSGNDLGAGGVTATELALHFPIPLLSLAVSYTHLTLPTILRV